VARRDERGSGTLLMIGVLAVLLAAGLAVTCAAGYIAAAHAARAAADLAALSGAVAIESEADGCVAARKTAVRNGTWLTSCDRVGDQVDFVISVEVARTIALGLPGLPSRVLATAHAGPR
jgi:secretion/DNA translocation related TadE-like protein